VNRSGLAAWLLCAVLASGPFCDHCAGAERVLVQTTTVSTVHEAQRTWLHELEPGWTGPVPAAYPLPGKAPLGAVAAGPDGERVAVWSQTPDAREPVTFLSAFLTNPLRPASPSWATWRDGAQAVAGMFWAHPADGTGLLVSFGTRSAAGGRPEGWLNVRAWPRGSVPAFEEAPASWPLPGRPVAAAHLPGSSTVAVLCDVPDTGRAAVHVRDAVGGRVVVEAQGLGSGEDDATGQVPAAIAFSRDGRHLFVLTTGYVGEETVSWLHALDSARFEPVCAPRAVSGTASEGSAALVPCEAAACWVATRSPGKGFAFATKVAVAGGELVKKAEPSFTSVVRPIQMAVAPQGPGVAFGVGQLLEVWPDGTPGAEPVSYEEPIGALAWGEDRLYVGEGGRLHVQDTGTGASLWECQLQTGAITGILPLPASSSHDAQGLADADADGLADALDPEPATPSPVLDLPQVVTLRGEGAGSAFRGVYVAGHGPVAGEWRLEYDRAAMPWLRVYPTAGTAPGWFLMGVDPAGYGTPATVVEGWLAVHCSGTRPDLPAARSPGPMLIRVLPRRNEIRRILWLLGGPEEKADLRGAADPYQLRALADLLAAPPHHFSHRATAGAFLEPFAPYAVVVITAAAAAHGAVNRPELLDYVTAGGSLLFLGRCLAPDTRMSSARWLAPMDIHLDTTIRIEGVFPVSEPAGLCRHWGGFTIREGCKVGIAGPSVAVVQGPSGPEQCAFVAKACGRGRVAVLAAATPIETAALKQEGNRSFAADLFRWLANAPRMTQDVDDDGLPDAVEDPDGDGVADPGETDRFNPDSDGDGVPDGEEDRNRNGRVDPGESSPLNADSDGDGILDGADSSPAPPA
jgi:hypothetical protein